MEDAHLKLLFATAFRAPNFAEMFTTNNPVLLGDPNLDPEKINTYEIGLGYNFSKHIRGNINYFYNRIRDRIVRAPVRELDTRFKTREVRGYKGLRRNLRQILEMIITFLPIIPFRMPKTQGIGIVYLMFPYILQILV